MIDDRLLEGAPDFERKFVTIRQPMADAHPSVRKGANF